MAFESLSTPFEYHRHFNRFLKESSSPVDNYPEMQRVPRRFTYQFLFTLLFLGFFGSLFAQTAENSVLRPALPRELTLNDHMFILDLQDSVAPRVLEDRKEIVFTYRPDVGATLIRDQGYQNQPNMSPRGPGRVSIAFGHEQFRILYPMDRSPNGVFFFYFDYNRSFQEQFRVLEYRFIVDGVWMEDPRNPSVRSLLSGLGISQVALPAPSVLPETAPLLTPAANGIPGRTVRFVYETLPGQALYLSGSFNAWDPYLYRMRERADTPGLYELTIHLPPGEYHYQFTANGRRTLDPLNGMFGTDRNGVVYSRFMVPQ